MILSKNPFCWNDRKISDLPANASKVEIKNAITEHNPELKAYKEQLTNMVPYRALAGFFNKSSEAADWGSIRRMTAYIERINRDTVLLPYTLGEESKLKKKVYFQDAWVEMIQDQTVSILGWIQYESCYRNNLHSLWAGQELCRKGNSEEEFMNILQKNMQPVYDSARRQGYEFWNRG